MSWKSNRIVAIAIFGLLLAGCSGSDGGCSDCGGGNHGLVPITGTVSAPGGTVAFNPPTGLRRMLAEFFGRTAHAALPGLDPVSGVSVRLIEIDNNGAQVGLINTAITNAGGVYTLMAPGGFAPASKFVIRAQGASSHLDALVTGTTVNVDPATDATRAVVLSTLASTGGSLAAVSTADIIELQETVEGLAQEIDSASKTTAAGFSSALQAETNKNEEAHRIALSITAAGGVTGTVTDAAGPLADITIVVRDFGNWVTRAVARTDALGRYTVTVPPGNYILGAINRTATSTAASEWWTSGGGAVKQLGAEKIVVGAALITKDFVLGAGGRISGTVTAEAGGTPLPGVIIKVRDFLNAQSVANVKTGGDGTYRINLAPGSYFLLAENTTLQPYASETYNTLNGGDNFGQAARLDVSADGAVTADFSLQSGRMISGLVSDPVTGPVPGMRVRFDDSVSGNEHASLQRTNNVGEYRVWLRPGVYTVRSRGQISIPDVDVTTANQTQNFAAAVGEVKMTLQDNGGNPVSQAKVHLRDSTGRIINKEASNSDGTVSVYSSVTATNDLLEIKIDNGQMIGSTIYNGRTRLLGGDVTVPSGDSVSVTVGSTNDTLGTAGTITLPAGGVLSGTVRNGVGAPLGNITIQVRNGGTGGGARFVNTSTQSDGTYSISLPVSSSLPNGAYTRVCAFTGPAGSICPNTGTGTGSGAGYQFFDGVAITANSTTPRDFVIP